ncbi:MAG: hypothetical protein K0R51_1361, partial [Cytophagaceae bacterium]|nr:hypothetical protein [Cytophagaceae bacterium]
QSYQGYTAIPNLDLYYQSREPDATFMDAEIIKRITYPTGGYSDFYFEPHTYATLVKQNPTLSLQTLSSNKLAGGLRIKRIEHYESSSPVSLVKEYFYVKDYMDGGTVSSGVLSGEPIYFQAGLTYYNNPYSKFSSLPFNYMNTSNGNHITYTQITEKSTEGYTVHTYTNQDNGYLDKNALTSVTSGSTSSSYQGKMFGKLELERGQPITIKQYADDKFLLREEVNEYNDDPNRYNNYVRSIYNLNDLNNAAYIMIAVPIYTFYPYLKRKIEREYFRSGGSFSIVTEFVYDPVSNLIRSKEVIRSDANKMKTTYKYPLDYSNTFTASSTDEAYDLRALRDANVVNIPVETTNIIVKGGADYVIDSEERYFENLKTERIFKLETVSPIAASNFSSTTVTSSGFISDSRYKEDILFTRYDDRGNVQEMIRQDGITVVYLWAYKSSYPVAKIVNATYNQVEIALGSTVLTNLFNSYDNAWIRSTLKNLKNSLTNAQVYTYIYEPLKGIISESDPYGKVTNYEYDKYSRLSLIKDDDNSIIKRYVYQTQQFKRLNLSTNTINFGSIPHVYTVSKTVRVTNSSNLPFTISSISKPSWCTYVINGSSTVLPGEYVEVTVTFTPTGISTYSGTLQVLSDAEGSNTITLNGIGLGTRVISISGNLNFGTVYGNMGGFPVTTRTFTIQNSGTGTLTVTGIESPFPGIMTLNWSSGTIGPGQSQVVTLTFAPVMESIYSGPINIVCDKTSGTNTITAEGWAIFNP